jgi:zinc transport system substrate-binding protein
MIVMLVLVISSVGLSGCAQETVSVKQDTPKIKMAASSSQMTCLVKAVGGDQVEVRGPIVPPTICPGHFDIKPSDVVGFSDCSVLFAHTFEPFVTKIVYNIGNPDLKVVQVEVIGAWMAPVKQKEAAGKVLTEMKKLYPKNAAAFEQNTKAYIEKIDQVSAQDQELFKQHNTAEGKVICHEFQKELLEWMGFQVVGTYPRPDALTPAMVKDLIDLGRQEGVSLVVDHLQSGPGEGKEIADSIGAMNIGTTFFPGMLVKDGNYFEELDANVKQVLAAWDEKRVK